MKPSSALFLIVAVAVGSVFSHSGAIAEAGTEVVLPPPPPPLPGTAAFFLVVDEARRGRGNNST